MIRKTHFKMLALLVGSTLLATLSSVGRAQSTYSVNLNTTPLMGNPNGPFYLDFQLNDGSGTNDANNTVTLSGFNFGIGGPSGSPNLSGGATGSLSSTVTITDSSFVNEFYQAFMPGSALHFSVALTGNPDVGGTPDEFSFALLDGSLNEIPTSGAADAFVVQDITGSGGSPQLFSGTGAYSGIGAPTVQTGSSSATPEPGAFTLFAGLATALGSRCRRRRRASSPV